MKRLGKKIVKLLYILVFELFVFKIIDHFVEKEINRQKLNG